MLVLPEYVLKELMTHIVGTTHTLTDTAGNPQVINTIAEPQLRMAALVAVEIAVGQTIWPGDRRITIQRPKRTVGIFEEVDG